MYVPVLVPDSSHRSESLAIITAMLSESSGLWKISDARTGLLRKHMDALSSRSKSSIGEMISIAERGDLFWPTKAEYYAALHEIKIAPASVGRKQVDIVISDMIKGARLDNVSDRAWVKQAIEILRKISADV
jgi:hypothetical protein